MKICIIWILRNGLLSTFVALIGFRDNFKGEPIGRAEVEVRVGKLKNERLQVNVMLREKL